LEIPLNYASNPIGLPRTEKWNKGRELSSKVEYIPIERC
jgi:hypothetical protein